jgi:hypothetical protein
MLADDPKTIEQLIAENRDKFCVDPEINHMDRFLSKLDARIRHFISIVPYLVRVVVATTVIFVASVVVWNNYIRKDRNEISLGNKISNVVSSLRKTQ